ncbi:hypothetical protein SDC9_192518 [bioreactor metagenome]|uniref:Uncharacterized protein n=1 Tax=bioreactor metagenome TaxID=1076179 RepID=A0A645I0Y6_9ZZZZ
MRIERHVACHREGCACRVRASRSVGLRVPACEVLVRRSRETVALRRVGRVILQICVAAHRTRSGVGIVRNREGVVCPLRIQRLIAGDGEGCTCRIARTRPVSLRVPAGEMFAGRRREAIVLHRIG